MWKEAGYVGLWHRRDSDTLLDTVTITGGTEQIQLSESMMRLMRVCPRVDELKLLRYQRHVRTDTLDQSVLF